ncbi:MAG: class I SAM-dependent methyltransferase, partial [Chloroflexi bacterium]|nr:class I SAM-dependent methyltransferase [Chloroflexota bacterium]
RTPSARASRVLIMGCHGGFSLDEATRRSWYNPEAILQNLRSGMVFVDIGCGDGFFSILAAKKVGATGKVYGVDTDASAIERLKQKAKNEGLKNIIAKVGKAEDMVFCEGCADFVFYSMDLHDFSDPAKVLKNAKQMIKPTGWIIDLDWKKIDMQFGPPVSIRFSEEYTAGLLQSAGFTVADVRDVGPYHYLLTAKP